MGIQVRSTGPANRWPHGVGRSTDATLLGFKMAVRSVLRRWVRLALWGAGLLALTSPVVSFAQDITIKGASFYRDGATWEPKGIMIEGFNEPPGLRVKNKRASVAHDYWGPAEIDAIKRVFLADTVRFAVSQPGLDPRSPIYDPNYAPELIAAFKQARAAGLIVIPSMDAQAENGVDGLPCMPNDSTVRAWRTLGPALVHDRGVMLELFNEPCKGGRPEDRAEWAAGTQAVIDAVRAFGSQNILLVGGLHYARTTTGLFPMIHDRLTNRLALSVHPYFSKGWFETPQQWDREFGSAASTYPTLASEWNATSGNGCVDSRTPELALTLMRFLEHRHIGLIAWAIDSSAGRLVQDHDAFAPTDYTHFKSCGDGSDAGGGQLVAKFPHD